MAGRRVDGLGGAKCKMYKWGSDGLEKGLRCHILPDSNQTNVQGPKWLNHGQWGATGKSKF